MWHAMIDLNNCPTSKASAPRQLNYSQCSSQVANSNAATADASLPLFFSLDLQVKSKKRFHGNNALFSLFSSSFRNRETTITTTIFSLAKEFHHRQAASS
jgi:hypothetical protein